LDGWLYFGGRTNNKLMIIKVNYTVSDIYMSTSVSPVYIKVVYSGTSSGGGTWGTITGTLSAQTDLQAALDLKVPTSRVLTINGVAFDLSANRSWTIAAGVSSVGLSMPSAFTVGSSPITSSGTLAVTGAGTTLQYIDGTGALQTLPTRLESDSLVATVRNQSGATMTKGTVVYISGATGNKPLISKALATGDATSAQTLGLLQTDIANNADGHIVIIGNVTDLDTSALTEGQQLYLSGVTAGTYTSTKPYAPIHLVYVAIVIRSHPTQGTLSVKIQNGFEMDELHNVSAQSPANNDGLFWNASTSLWSKNTIGGVLGYTPVTSARNIATTSPLVGGGDLSADRTLSIPAATTSVNGYLTSTDWTTFNNKQAALNGSISGDLTITGVLRETITTNRQTASYTLVLADRGKLLEMNSASANTATIPLNSSVAFPIGTKIDVTQYGAGQTTLVATSGVTIRTANGWLKLNAQYAAATLIKIATDEWYLFGNLNA
jgi:hypothetical protein